MFSQDSALFRSTLGFRASPYLSPCRRSCVGDLYGSSGCLFQYTLVICTSGICDGDIPSWCDHCDLHTCLILFVSVYLQRWSSL